MSKHGTDDYADAFSKWVDPDTAAMYAWGALQDYKFARHQQRIDAEDAKMRELLEEDEHMEDDDVEEAKAEFRERKRKEKIKQLRGSVALRDQMFQQYTKMLAMLDDLENSDIRNIEETLSIYV